MALYLHYMQTHTVMETSVVDNGHIIKIRQTVAPFSLDKTTTHRDTAQRHTEKKN